MSVLILGHLFLRTLELVINWLRPAKKKQ